VNSIFAKKDEKFFFAIFFKEKKKNQQKISQQISLKNSALKRDFHVSFIPRQVRVKKKYWTKSLRNPKKKFVAFIKIFFRAFRICPDNVADLQS